MANNKNVQPINIPMASKLTLAEVDDLIHTVENPSFAEKDSITYQGIIRNSHVTQGDGYITTHGSPIIKSQLYFSKWQEWKRASDSEYRPVKEAKNILDSDNEELTDAKAHLEYLNNNEPDLQITNPKWTEWDESRKQWLIDNPKPEERITNPKWTEWDKLYQQWLLDNVEPAPDTPEHEEWQAKKDQWLLENVEPEKIIDNPAFAKWQSDKAEWERLNPEPSPKVIDNPAHKEWVDDKAATQGRINELNVKIPKDEEEVRKAEVVYNQWLALNPEPEKDIESNEKIGSILTDSNGKAYKVPHQWLLKDSFQIKNYTGGKIISAAVYEENLFVLFDDAGVFSLVMADRESKELKELYQLNNLSDLDPVISATIGSVYNGNNAPTLWMLTKQEKLAEDKWSHEFFEAELKKNTKLVKHKITLKVPLGHNMTATDVKGYGEGKTVAFEDIDQRRRAAFRIRPGKEMKYIQYYGTVSPAGLITGEPLPFIFNTTNNAEYPISTPKILNNGTLAWNVKEAVNKISNVDKVGLTLKLGYDANDNILFPGWKYIKDGGTKYGYWVSANISINDTDDAYPSSDPRHFPKDYFISNFADSKGVYFDWGQGWSKSYYRIASVNGNRVHYLSLATIGATPAESDATLGKKLVRDESLIAKGKIGQTGSIPYVAGHLNERVYTVGGTNKGDDSILGTVPFSVDLLYQGFKDPQAASKLDLFRTQVFELVETSYAFKQTLITTPSEGSGDRAPINLSWENNKSMTLFANGEVYDIIKSSDFRDLWMDKIADYSFKLNVLDGKNLVKEDRDGNVSLSRAFIPYNMDCVIDVLDLKLDSPGAKDYDTMSKDPNDAWFEGVGFNVNLDVDEPSMSFLLPKIKLPLWISEDDWNSFKNEAVDRRNSILKPVLRGSFLEDESVDVYYTLQNDKQDCTYKSTQILKLGAEAEKAGWNIYGKSTYDVLKKNMSWWMEEANTVIFPIGIGSTIAGINFITPSAQLPQGYASRLYTQNNRLFMGFNYLSQIWHGATIFTIYGSNYYYDGQGIYFVGADQDFTNNNFVTYALGMKFLANSGSEAFFYSDFEKRIYVFTGSNTLQAADLLSSIEGTIVDAVYSSKEQALYMLTSEGRILVRTQTDLCQLPGMNPEGHLEGTTQGAAMVDKYKYKIFSPWEGEDVLPFALRTEHFGSPDFVSKLAYVDILFYKNENDNPKITVTCQTLNGIEKTSEKINIQIRPENWKGNTYRMRLTPNLNIGNAFDIGIHSMDKIGVQSICMYMEPISSGKGDAWQNNVINETPSVGLIPENGNTVNIKPSISVF